MNTADATLINGDARQLPLADRSVHCAVTSPPYWGLRDYGVSGQLGSEPTPEEYVAQMVAVFREVRRVLRDDGTLWLNIGDSYAASGPGATGKHLDYLGVAGLSRTAKKPQGRLKAKDLVGIPWMVAFALRDDGWYLRSDTIWSKTNPMTESVRDRPAKSHEYVFLLSKQSQYFFDAVAVRQPVAGTRPGGASPSGQGFRSLRSVWTISCNSYRGAHFATYPIGLVEPCILAGSSAKGCCPNCGAPWRQLTRRERKPTRPGASTKVVKSGSAGAAMPDRLDANVVGNRDPQRHITTVETVGWEPTCKCGIAATQPCIVLDPFSGAATTALACLKHGRRYIGNELNPDYLTQSRERIAAFAAKGRPKPTAGPARIGSTPGAIDLFNWQEAV